MRMHGTTLTRSTVLVEVFLLCSLSQLLKGTVHHGASSAETLTTDRIVGNIDCRTRNCLPRKTRRTYDMESMKLRILQKLRMTETPVLPVSITLPRVPYIDRTIEEYNNPQPPETNPGLDDTESATIQNIFYIAQQDSVRQAIRFGLDSSADSERVTSARLNVFTFLDRPLDHSGETVSIVVHRFLAPAGSTNKKEIRRRRLPTGNQNSWVQFNLTLLAIDWINQPATNLGLFVEITDSRGGQLSVLSANYSVNEQMKPYLDMQFKEASTNGTLSRPRRTTSNECDDSTSQTLCCRYPLELDFVAFGWSWVIAPRRVNAYYCSGQCPYLYHPARPTTLLRSNSLNSTGGGPCCAPTKYADVKILYMAENGTITHSVIPGLIVAKCGCL